MEYFKLLNLEKEPFSNSPDPDYFFKSRQHKDCLQKLELSLRLRRGLNVVIGEVGTGKTTLCRQMIKKFSTDEEFETHLILDPHMADPAKFLQVLAGMFEREPKIPTGDWADHKEFIKQYLYKRGVDENRVVVLIIDEGQKIPTPILEILRELLNYETNAYKLLQIVIFAQREFEKTLEKHANFADRINLLHVLGPLGFKDTRQMIDYRLQKAGAESSVESMLSFFALVAIYRATGGYPRKIVNLCHRIMLAMIVKNRKKAGWRLVRSCVNRGATAPSGRWQKATGALLVIIGVAGIAYTGFMPEPEKPREQETRKAFQIKKESTPAVSFPDKTKPEPPPVAAVDQAPVKTPPETTPPETTRPPYAAVEAQNIKTALTEPADAAPPAEAETAREAAAVPETAVPPAAVPRAPQTLGMIRMQDNETLSWMMVKVYGEYTNARRRAVAAENPGVKNLDNIYKGQAVGFPAEALENLYIPDYLRWIRVGRTATVSEALDMIRRHSTRAAPLRMIPNWHPEKGLRFDVIFWEYFQTADDAARFLATLPVDLQSISEVMSGWGKRVVFYANPCPGIG